MRVTLFLERASVDGVEATLWGEVSAAVAIRQAERATRGFPVGFPWGHHVERPPPNDFA
jgi:hypothetical protein